MRLFFQIVFFFIFCFFSHFSPFFTRFSFYVFLFFFSLVLFIFRTRDAPTVAGIMSETEEGGFFPREVTAQGDKRMLVTRCLFLVVVSLFCGAVLEQEQGLPPQ